ncbi:unnamed protein product [Hymenolepis diminuta]|uniref:Uncharacterized protein n=1 Tax=Hymenolepis diminuta TaxID=6216 RepID=A0A564XYG5_HYMDI|nr:unnamed protein product [Hymenolepis diminuta]
MACYLVNEELAIELSRWRPHTNSTIDNMENIRFDLLIVTLSLVFGTGIVRFVDNN